MIDNYQLKRLSFKFYLEGIEIPFRSVTISHNDTTTFNINIPPYHEAFNLETNTNGIIVYREKKSDEWKMLCEGVYIGNGYSKRPNDRTVTLKFKDIKWFIDNARLYDFMESSSVFGPREAVFFGDARYVDRDYEETEQASNSNFATRTAFIDNFGEDEPITESVEYIFKWMLTGNDFLDAYVPKYKIGPDRFKVIENDKTEEVFSYHVIQNIYNEILNESSTMTKVIDLIYSIAQIIQYDIKPVPGMTRGNPLNSYSMKPNLQFTIPPACNVIFPDENTSFNYQKDETQIATRYRLVDDIFGAKSSGYYAPSELLENFDDENKSAAGNVTDEEKFKGIIPYQTTLPLSQTLSIGFNDGSLEEQIKSKSSFVNYLYYKRKYKTVPLSVEVAFKPDIMPGFPALIMDKEIPLIGYLVSANHNINPESGYATTTLTMSHVRPFNEDFPQLAGWYSTEQFGVNNISSTYQDNFGVGGAFDEYGDVDIDSNKMVSVKERIKDLQKDYYSAGDRIAFQNKFKRQIATFKDYREVLGIDMIDGELHNGPFDIDLNVSTEEGEQSVSEVRRQRVEALKRRMESTSPRKFAKEDE